MFAAAQFVSSCCRGETALVLRRRRRRRRRRHVRVGMMRTFLLHYDIELFGSPVCGLRTKCRWVQCVWFLWVIHTQRWLVLFLRKMMLS